ncbi:hypothetical protein LTR28_003683 [Elasticomyces elasticus]|nr:hypothetical protein LTR28_003683 [Elasticomyces elasticus]
MTRASQTLTIFVLISSIYAAAFLGLLPLSDKVREDIVPLQQIPFTSLVAFGSYLLAKLGYGVLTFNDVPEAHKELMMQIETARAELRAKGVEVD